MIDLEKAIELIEGNIIMKLETPNVKYHKHSVYMFPQTIIDNLGEITTNQITIIEFEVLTMENISKLYYGVFIDDKPYYMVENPSDEFYKDMKNYSIKTKEMAKKTY